MEWSIRVWAVDLVQGASTKERAGTLTLDEAELRFRPEKDGESGFAIALVEIDKVRRLHGSPVLVVTYRRKAAPWKTAFYFVQPPPLAPLMGSRDERNVLAALRNPKRKARRDNVGYLGLSNRTKKDELVAWERAVRAAIAAVQGP